MSTLTKKLSTILASFSLLLVPVTPALAVQSTDTISEYILSVEQPSDMSFVAKLVVSNGGQVLDSNWFTQSLSVKLSTSKLTYVKSLSNGKASFHENADFKLTQTQSPAPWGVDRLDQTALPLDSSFTSTFNGSGVDIYILDTGVREDHTDFAGRLKPGYTNVNDGGGIADCNGHGTHVAGTAAGSVYGVAKGASIIPVRVMDCNNGTDSFGLSDAINWVIADHKAGVPAVVNMSLGGSASTFIDDLVKAMEDDGIVVIAAAGNEATNACLVSPARSSSAITVASSLINDSHAWYSNRGTCIDIYAPGGGDGSPSNPAILSAGISSSTGAALSSGTSMAAPHVAGAAAIYLSSNPTATPQQVRQAILNAAAPVVISAPPQTTNKLLQITAFTAPAPVEPAPVTPVEPAPVTPVEPAPVTPTPVTPVEPTPVTPAPEIVTPAPVVEEPKAPTSVENFTSSIISRAAARISWTAPEKNGGAVIKSYRVAIYDADTNKLIRSFTQPASKRSAIITRSGKSYRVYVSIQATNTKNVAGDNFISPIIDFPAPPTPVSNLSAKNVVKGTVELSWTEPAQIGNNTRVWYEVRVSRSSSGRSWNRWVRVSSTSVLLNRLSSNQVRFVEVRAVNAFGVSSPTRIQIIAQ
jgi:subtilisin family serine protease